MTVNGQSVTMPTGSDAFGAIDTGTTLVTGPPDMVAEIYAKIPGSQALTGAGMEGFHQYRESPPLPPPSAAPADRLRFSCSRTSACNTDVEVTMRFGASTISWPISNADFLVGDGTLKGMCVGAIIGLDTGGTSAPAWIVGDTFLKNVYSVYRARPPAVGFATLSPAALAMNGKLGPAPTPTIGAVSATANGLSSNRAAARQSVPVGVLLTLVTGLVGVCVLL